MKNIIVRLIISKKIIPKALWENHIYPLQYRENDGGNFSYLLILYHFFDILSSTRHQIWVTRNGK